MMRTAVLQAPRRFEVAERPTPRPGRGAALVRVAATAVCHTDLSIYTGQHPGLRYPVVLGHEATGVVEAVGPDVRIPVGARVVINPIIACGACDCCLRGDENLCRRAGLLGRELDGSLAEQVVLAERYLHPLPPEIGLEAATLIETLATVHHAQRRGGPLPRRPPARPRPGAPRTPPPRAAPPPRAGPGRPLPAGGGRGAIMRRRERGA